MDAERSRLYQDVEAERRAQEASSGAVENAEDRVRRLHVESDERREGIAREVRQYLTPEPKAVEPSVADAGRDAGPV